MRALSTQNCVPLRNSLRTLFSIRAVTMTFVRSSLSDSDSTVPSSTERYLIFVLPASIPEAVGKVMVISGPRLLKVV